MPQQKNTPAPTAHRLIALLTAGALLAASSSGFAAPAASASQAGKAPAAGKLAPCSGITMAPAANIVLGKSTLIRLPAPVVRMVVGGLPSGRAGKPLEAEISSAVAQQQAQQQAQTQQRSIQMNQTLKTGVAEVDVMLLSPSELYLLGKRVGTMNVILQGQSGQCTVMDINVTMDAGGLQAKLRQLMPGEDGIEVSAADDSLILSGEVSDPIKVERATSLAMAYAPEKRVVNMMRTSAPSQVMLEVTVAEISKKLLERFGASVGMSRTNGSWTYLLLSDFLSGGGGLLSALKAPGKFIDIDAEKSDGLVRVLAEPNLMALSGQEASFLSGGKIFIPVSQTQGGLGGVPVITLAEKEFGVGVKFTPTVLDGDRINLKVASEVSELSQTGSPFTTLGNVTAVLPSFTTRRADTSVQLRDGQSFAIAGLIKNNLSESVKRFPGLGEVPVIGALFRSSEFQKDMTELLFIITPRLVKPLPARKVLPTDNFTEPGRARFHLLGQMEGSRDAAQTQAAGDKPAGTPTTAPAGPASDAAARPSTQSGEQK